MEQQPSWMIRDECLRFEDIVGEQLRTYLNECERHATSPNEVEFVRTLAIVLDAPDRLEIAKACYPPLSW